MEFIRCKSCNGSGRFKLNEALKRLIDEEYTRHPFYGSRKVVVHMFRCGQRS